VSWVRRLIAVSGIAVLAAVPTACGSKAPAVGVARIGRVVEVAYKPCAGDSAKAGIAELDLFSSDRPDTPVWTARHRTGGPAVLELPVVGRFPGYAIVDHRPGERFDPNLRYSFDAIALDGTRWGGPSFHPRDLRSGRVEAAGRDLDFAQWIDAPASCPNLGVDGPLLTGLVVAAGAGGTLISARALRRVFRRDRDPREPEPSGGRSAWS
jgi:hypothetical protein